jgi:ribosomal protein L33
MKNFNVREAHDRLKAKKFQPRVNVATRNACII